MAYLPRQRSKKKILFFFPIPKKQVVIKYSIIGFVSLVIFGYIGAFLLFAWYGRDLPKPGKLSEARENSTIFYDRNGAVIYDMYKDKNRIPVKQDDIPDILKKATIAIEDKRFYEHKGISEIGILRAAFSSFLGNPQGGSTITQQLIKNVLLTSEHRLSRKIKEAILAYEVEKKYEKDEILSMYLNEAPYGGNYWGIGSASKGYFDKSPNDLNLVEAAFLSGLPQQPSVYSPFVGKENAWKGRTTDVLRRMREDNYINRDEEEKALEQLEKLKFSKNSLRMNAPHFVFYIRDQIEKDYGAGIFKSGIQIYTTLDLDLQKDAEEIVSSEISNLEDYDVGNGALVSMDPKTGEIITYVGSYDFSNEDYGKFDVVSQGLRQPGSTLKPIEYAVAFEKGYTASSVIMDVKTVFPNVGDEEDYVPVNYDGKYRGPVQLRFALGNSLNVPAVKLLGMIGIRDFLQLAYEMGLDSLEPTDKNMSNLGLSASLGGGETTLLNLTKAYSVFANEGKNVEPYGISEIKDFDGKQIYKRKKQSTSEILSPEICFLISHILSDNNARFETFGSNSFLNIPGNTVAVKSGTTDDKRDNWTVGYTKDIVLGVWVGNNDNSKMNQQIASGATGASPIWHAAMRSLLAKYEDGIMDKPDKVNAIEIDSFLGGLPKDGIGTRTEYYIEGTEPTEISSYYQKIKISKSNGKLANDIEIKSGNYEEKDYYLITESDPISGDGVNRWQDAIDAWAREMEDEKYHYPTETSDSNSDDVVVSYQSPSNKSRVNTNDVEIKVKITSLEKIKETKIYVDGEERKVISGNRDSISEKINIDNGKHTIRVESRNEKDKSGSSEIKISINEEYQD